MFAVSTSNRDAAPASPARGDGYHHGNLRAALVAAGLELLEQGGGTDFSLREAARRVGVTVNATYRHFAGKDALLAAIAAEGFRRFATALLAGASHGSTPRERMLGAGRAYIEFARTQPALFRLMFGRFGATAHGAELAGAAAGANAVLRGAVAGLLGKPMDDPAVTISVLRAWSLAHGLSHLVMDGQVDTAAAGYPALVDAVLGSYVP